MRQEERGEAADRRGVNTTLIIPRPATALPIPRSQIPAHILIVSTMSPGVAVMRGSSAAWAMMEMLFCHTHPARQNIKFCFDIL